MTIVYVTSGAWGSGSGTPNSAAQVDGNFYDVDLRIGDLATALAEGKRIESISSAVNSMTITFTDASTQVIQLPIASMNFVGQWYNSTPYLRGQLITVPTLGLFQVLEDHTTPALPAEFDPNAVDDDTDSSPLYAFLIPIFSINLPGGTAGQIITKVDSADFNIQWTSLAADLVAFDPSTGSGLTSTNVADAIEEVAELVGSPDAADVTFSPSSESGLSSTNVADALDEVAVLAGDTGDLLAANNLSDVANASTSRTNLGLGGAAVLSVGTTTGTVAAGDDSRITGAAQKSSNLSDLANASTARTNLGVAIGTDVQAFDAQLSSLVRQNSKSTAYTTVLTDGGKHLLHPSADTTARTFTIDSNANVAYPIGTAISFVNQHSGGVITIEITSDTMRLAGAGTTGSRTLAADGIATALKIATTEWIISGTGLS